MSYPSFPAAPGIGGLLIPFDPSFMIFPGGSSVGSIIGTVTTWPNNGVSGGGGIYRPFNEMDVMTAMLGTWVKPPGGSSEAVVFPLLWGKQRGFIALAAGGAT